MSGPAESKLTNIGGEPVKPGKGDKAEKERERAGKAALDIARAQAAERRAKASADYEHETASLPFTKDFNMAMERIMRDPCLPIWERVYAYIRRYAWGEWALFAMGEDGHPRYQVNVAEDLGIDARRVSQAVAWGQRRGYLEQHPKQLIPVLEGELSPLPPGEEHLSPEWIDYRDKWNVAHPQDFQREEVAKAAVREVSKHRLTDFKISKREAKKAAASLLETARPLPDPAMLRSSSVGIEKENHDVLQTDAAKEQTYDGGDCTPDTEPSTPFADSCERGRTREEQRAAQSETWTRVEAADFLFGQIAHLQQSFPESEFAKPAIDPDNPDHRNAVRLMLEAFGTHDQDYITTFWMWVVADIKGLGQRSQGHKREGYNRAPGQPHGPQSVGLIVYWARDYATQFPYRSGRTGSAHG